MIFLPSFSALVCQAVGCSDRIIDATDCSDSLPILKRLRLERKCRRCDRRWTEFTCWTKIDTLRWGRIDDYLRKKLAYMEGIRRGLEEAGCKQKNVDRTIRRIKQNFDGL